MPTEDRPRPQRDRPFRSNFARAQQTEEEVAERQEALRRQLQESVETDERHPVAQPRGTREANERYNSSAQKLAINRQRLEEDCQHHSDLLFQVSEEVSLLRSRRDRAKKELEETEAEIYITTRRAVPSGERVSEAELKATVTVNAQVRGRANALLIVSAELARWEALKEAVQQRSYMLRELVQLYLARYYGGDPVRAAENRTRDRLSDQYRAERRREHAERTGNSRD